jgi:hypothetical protein
MNIIWFRGKEDGCWHRRRSGPVGGTGSFIVGKGTLWGCSAVGAAKVVTRRLCHCIRPGRAGSVVHVGGRVERWTGIPTWWLGSAPSVGKRTVLVGQGPPHGRQRAGPECRCGNPPLRFQQCFVENRTAPGGPLPSRELHGELPWTAPARPRDFGLHQELLLLHFGELRQRRAL